MERWRNRGDCMKSCGQRAKRRKRRPYGVICVMLCLLMTIMAFMLVALRRDREKVPGSQEQDNAGYSQMEAEQRETPRLPDRADAISVEITAANVVVLNADDNSVLYQKAGTDRIAPASTAKLITALTALEFCAPEDEMTVGPEIEMIHEGSSVAWLNQGDTLTVRQLLIALLLPSGNDAAYTLAVNTGKRIAGDNSLTNEQAVALFMDQVNEKARNLGAERSNFVAPDGYDAEGQYTTAYDLVILAKACLDNPVISDIVACHTSYEKWTNGREVTYYNANELLDPASQYYCPEVIGLKTGTSSLGGACMISAAVIDGQTYICAVMGSTEEDRFQDSVDIYGAIKAQGENG